MRIPFEWLKEIINIDHSAEDVAHRLTMIGLEIEAAENVDGDTVFEVNVTPNRPDCLSVIGTARELSAAYGIPVDFPEHDVMAEAGELDFNVDILDKNLCHRYAGRIVRDITIGPSPDWLKKRIEKCGIRSINNIVDITNYVLLEFGHPLHAFDLATISGNCIRVATPANMKCEDQKIRTLDNIEHDVTEDTLLIWDAEKPIAIAGVIGGSETEVKSSTKDIFIESAYFDPVSVRKTSKSLGIKTESSYRFERGTDIKILKKALDRAAYLMKEVAGGTIYGKIDLYPKRYVAPKITVRYERINKVLGLRLTRQEIVDCLERLGIEVKLAVDRLVIKPPTYRRDLLKEHDIIEEIARIYGYEKIPAQLPEATIGMDGNVCNANADTLSVRRVIKDALLKSGFTEAINYSFMGIQDLDMLGIAAGDERREPVLIMNPLKTEEVYMRTTLIHSLIRNIQYNISHGNRELRLFEMARVYFHKDRRSLPVEREHVAAVFYKEKTKSLYHDDVPDFYMVKGMIEAIFHGFNIHNYSFVRSSEPFLHPGQGADVFVDGTKIGYLGTLSPMVLSKLDIKANKPSVVLAELDVDAMLPFVMQFAKYSPLPKYPFTERDTALVVDASLEASEVITLLKGYTSDLIEDAYVFDVYVGGNIPEGKKSVAFNVRYRASDRTLKDEEIDVLHKSLVAYIVDRTKGQLRT